MPLSRRVKGACTSRTAVAVRERKPWEEGKSSGKVQNPGNEDEVRETVESMDDTRIQEAKSTIQRLARKYLHKAQGSGEQTSGSVDIVRVEEGEAESLHVCDRQSSDLRGMEKEMERSDVFDFRGSQQTHNKENRAKRERGRAKRERGCTKPAKTRPKRTYFTEIPSHGESGELKMRLQITPVKRPPKTKPSFISPEELFKIPKPTLGQSTPNTADRGAVRRQSLFGFETLESPLTLSPVAATPFLQESPVKSPEEKITRSSSHNRLVGTYDIPIRKPTPRKQQARRKPAERSSAMEVWAKKLNTEFAEVDQFELAVE